MNYTIEDLVKIARDTKKGQVLTENNESIVILTEEQYKKLIKPTANDKILNLIETNKIQKKMDKFLEEC
jgi:hypothetical protein